MSELAARILARCEPEGDCLVWQGAKQAEGYGVKRDDDGTISYTHRLIYRELVGPIPEGMTIDHVAARGCTSKACCNVEHLEAVTLAENLRRAHRKLTDEQITEIRESGEQGNVLAARFGVSRSAVYHCRTGYHWAEAA